MATQIPQPKPGLSNARFSFMRRLSLGCVLVMVAALITSGVNAEETPTLEYQVKAAFLIKFGAFVEWPDDKSSERGPFVIGIMGKDPLGKSFDESVKKERINGRPIVVRRGDTAADMRGCQIVFIPVQDLPPAGIEITNLSSQGILTIGESPDFARKIGVVGFIKEGGKVRFEINAALAERSGLKISSKLLQVGKIVADESHKG